MKVPFRLRRVSQPRPATALLLPGHDSAALLAVCARLGHDPWPAVFAVHDGFLLELRQPLREPVGGTIRLAELADNVLLPVDAELIPALLDDEARALGRERGLIFLPEGRVLAFAPRQPVAIEQLVRLDGLTRRSWQPLDQPSRLAERLVAITLDRPDPPPETIIEAGGGGIGEAQPRPGDAPMAKKVAGSTGMGLGKALAWLGQALGSQKLAKLGGKLMAASMNLVPRLTEKLFGKQEAALRELLKYFHAGDIEKALRHAIPLNANEPGVVAGGTELPNHATTYSLGNIFSGSGAVDFWISHDELFRELEREYRRQAEAATKRGDYRRAAFIYGKLLRDYRMAAAVLGQGGLHHDAAIIYLNRLGDHLAAAREFEADGEMDRALEIYRRKGEHAAAGDLLRRLGEEELALAEYKAAADELARTRGHCQAGDLMLSKAERPDLARGYFEAGWALRPEGAPVACANRLARLHADGGDHVALLRLVSEAVTHFAPSGNDGAAGEFFNQVAHLAAEPSVEDVREELRDRALLGLANKLRQRGGSAVQLVPALFAPGTVWETAVVSDAQFAVKAPTRRFSAATVSAVKKIPVQSVVTAVCQELGTGALYIGFKSGEVARCDPNHGDIQFLDPEPGPVLGFAVGHNSAESMLVVHSRDREENDGLACYLSTGVDRVVQRRLLGPSATVRWICPIVAEWNEWNVLLWDGEVGTLRVLTSPRLLPFAEVPLNGCPKAALLTASQSGVLVFDGREVSYLNRFPVPKPAVGFPCPFPVLSQDTSLAQRHAPLDWRPKSRDHVEIVGIGEGGTLGWLDLQARGIEVASCCVSAPGPFRAATLAGPGLIAAVTTDGVVWLRASPQGIRELSRRRISMPPPIACFAHEPTREVIVVAADGSLVRIAAFDHTAP